MHICNTYDLKRVRNDSDSHELLAVVATVHHQGVRQSLDDRALSLSESLCGITTGRVRKVDGSSDLDVIAANVILAFPPVINQSAHVPYVNEISLTSTSL